MAMKVEKLFIKSSRCNVIQKKIVFFFKCYPCFYQSWILPHLSVPEYRPSLNTRNPTAESCHNWIHVPQDTTSRTILLLEQLIHGFKTLLVKFTLIKHFWYKTVILQCEHCIASTISRRYEPSIHKSLMRRIPLPNT